jgi:hypothetical protein
MPIPGPTPVLDLNASESASASGSGATWYDLTANNYDFNMFSPNFTASIGGTIPGYYTFPLRNYTDPLTVYGEYNGTPAIGGNNVTTYAWVKVNSGWTAKTMFRIPIFYNGRDTNGNGFMVGTEAPPSSPIRVQAEASGNFQRYAANGVANDVWQCIAATISSTNIQFYINGAANGTSQLFSVSTPANGMWISNSNNLFSWLGDLSIIRFYSSVLTAGEIQDLYDYDLANYINPSPPAPTPYVGLIGGRTFGQGFAG